MKIAVISDIHGNITALESVLTDIKRRKADKIICLGDMVGKGPNSKEAIDICRKECEIIISGNWEYELYENNIKMLTGKANELTDWEIWYIKSIGEERMEFLGTLPHSTEFYLGGKLIRLFHAHPQNFNRCFQNNPLEKKLELFGYNDNSAYKELADIAIYADIHCAFQQIINERQLLNTGSVGNPLDITQASYIILEGDNLSLNIQFIRVSYDIEKEVEAAKNANIPNLEAYISELRTAVYFDRG